MPIIIHKTDLSPPARSVLMIAELLNLKYETIEVNLQNGDHMKPEYIEKNPAHTIPLLEDGDFVLADSHAINTYLVSKYGADRRAELYPSDLALRATIHQRLFFDATVLFPTGKAIATSIVQGKATGVTEEEIANMYAVYEILEKYLQKTKFIASDYFTLADVSYAATVSTMNVLVPIDTKFEKVHAWLNKLKDEEWYKKANVPGLIQIEGLIKMSIEKNSA